MAYAVKEGYDPERSWTSVPWVRFVEHGEICLTPEATFSLNDERHVIGNPYCSVIGFVTFDKL